MSDDNHQHSIKKSGLDSILESLNTLQKETAKLEYRMNIIERTFMLPISSHTVHRFDGVISESVSLENPSLYFELPLKTKEEADEFESKLKEEQFRNSIVRFMFIIQYFSKNSLKYKLFHLDKATRRIVWKYDTSEYETSVVNNRK